LAFFDRLSSSSRSAGRRPWSICQRGAARRDPPDAVVDFGLIPGELLAETDRGRVHQVRASGLHDRVELLGFLRQTFFEFPEGGQEALVDL